jgi:imidazolonepropionase-like amidohydrolase
MKKPKMILTLIAFVITQLSAQDVPSPAPRQTEKLCVKGSTVHVGNGKVISNAVVCFENGKVTMVADAATIKTDETLGKIIDATGKHLYPGFIALNTTLGLTEVEAVRATRDFQEMGSFNPNAKSAIAFNTDSRIIPTVRSNGVLFAQAAPQGGIISGSSSVLHLDAWNWEDAVVKYGDGIYLNWPSMFNVKGWWAEPDGSEENKEYQKQVEEIKSYFAQAKSYCESKHDKENLQFEAMRPLFDKISNLYVRTKYVLEIQAAIRFAEEVGVKIVLVDAQESFLIADELAAKKIAVILDAPHSLPTNAFSDIRQPYKTPAILQKAGVIFALSIGSSWQERNLPFQAGTAAAYGLSKEEAVAAISFNAAKILGVDNKIGTIEVGKSASFICSTGDALDMKSSNIEFAFIDGRAINLGNKQTDLYNKFSEKYGLK